MEVIVVFITCPTVKVARQIGTSLIEKQLAACVNIISRVESIYRWDSKVCLDQEVLLKVKTTKSRFADIQSLIESEHPYENPEILSVKVDQGATKYLKWVSEQVTIS